MTVFLFLLPSILSFASATVAAVMAYLAHRKVAEIHAAITSRSGELIEARRRADRADGVMAGIQAERDHSNDAGTTAVLPVNP